MLSDCCQASVLRMGTGGRVDVVRCTACGSLWSRAFLGVIADRPWADLTLAADFADALARRRRQQSTEIVKHFPELGGRSVLDYGAGQGFFLDALLAAGIEAAGCDIDLTAPRRSAAPLLQLSRPWEPPPNGWDVTAMLDVLEHHPRPSDFLDEVSSPKVLIKVPLATGPITRVARLFARLGRWNLLDALFLADDPSPHVVLFTPKGLERLASRSGWRLLRRARVADVGRELPQRMRIDVGQRSGLIRAGLSGVGGALEASASRWSDTAVFLFERNP